MKSTVIIVIKMVQKVFPEEHGKGQIKHGHSIPQRWQSKKIGMPR